MTSRKIAGCWLFAILGLALIVMFVYLCPGVWELMASVWYWGFVKHPGLYLLLGMLVFTVYLLYAFIFNPWRYKSVQRTIKGFVIAEIILLWGQIISRWPNTGIYILAAASTFWAVLFCSKKN